jgi:hypothetical protein
VVVRFEEDIRYGFFEADLSALNPLHGAKANFSRETDACRNDMDLSSDSTTPRNQLKFRSALLGSHRTLHNLVAELSLRQTAGGGCPHMLLAANH